MAAASPERIRAVTANFYFWQGLRWVPMGGALMIGAWRWTPAWPLADQVGDFVFVACMMLAITAAVAIGHYYRRTFGSVSPKPENHAWRSLIKWWFVYPALALSLIADGVLHLPILVSGPVWGAGVLGYWWSTGKGRPHYLLAAALLTALGFAPLFGIPIAGKAGMAPLFALLGLTYMIGGVLDHLELQRVLGPADPDATPA